MPLGPRWALARLGAALTLVTAATWPSPAGAGGWYLLLAPERPVPTSGWYVRWAPEGPVPAFRSASEAQSRSHGGVPPGEPVLWWAVPTAPLSKWIRHSAYDSARECEDARLRLLQERVAEERRSREEDHRSVCEAVAEARARLAAETDATKRAQLLKDLEPVDGSSGPRCAPTPRSAMDPADAQLREEFERIRKEMQASEDRIRAKMRTEGQCVPTDDPRLSPPITGPGGGWYLLVPFAWWDERSSRVRVDEVAPLKEWKLQAAYDSAQACQAAKAEASAEASTNLRERREDDRPTNVIHDAIADVAAQNHAQCIATNDPRLK